ncbi:MAG TPA: DUF4956 domain-containing protein [Bacteroidales bacterium]|nr:DUF4956 domain-containing protein [Bacteroidales bacterium]HOK99217.1 DUF4956 domain-containing protein [Bacteroidales bacterium]HPO66070.1 DUF4956 domain-containing protein [Bacteroidales bacterium]
MENIDEIKFLELSIYDPQGFTELLLRFSFNLLVVFIIVRLLYYPITRRNDYLFTYILIAVITFLICFMLGNVKLQLGFALGLFAVFGIIRYRTNPMPIKEMTYLFVIIGISVINALANKKSSYAEIFFTNFIVVAIIFGLEKIWLLRHESCKVITYEKIDLIKPEKRQELIADLEQRTGLKINRVEIGKINFMRDTVQISIYYYSDENTVDNYYADNDDDED